MLKREAWRISASMAAGAAFVVHVIEQPATDCALGTVTNLGEIHIRRRFRGWLAKEDFKHFNAAPGGRGGPGVSEERQKADLSQNARPFRRLREGVRSPFVVGCERDSVYRRQRAVDKSLVCREEVAIIPPFVDQQVDDRSQSLFLGALGHSLVELGIDRRILDQVLKSIELQQVCKEGPNTVLKAWRRNHPTELLFEAGLGVDRAVARRSEKFLVRPRVPQQERHA